MSPALEQRPVDLDGRSCLSVHNDRLMIDDFDTITRIHGAEVVRSRQELNEHVAFFDS